MADNDEVSGTPDHDATPTEQTRPVLPPDPAVDPAAPAATTAAPAPVLKPRWRDRVWSFRSMLAVALATLVLGGIVGGTIVAVADGGHDDRGFQRMGPGPGMPGGRGRGHFRDGGPGWRGNDGPQPPDDQLTPYGQPTPAPTPTPAPSP